MGFEFAIMQNERNYLRELANKYLEYASLPVMEERKKLWYDHNSLKGSRPIIVMEIDTFIDDFLPALFCESRAAREIERNLMNSIRNFDLINDDKVISPYYTIYWQIEINRFCMEIKREYAEDSQGRKHAFADQHPFHDLQKDLSHLKSSSFHIDRECTIAWKNAVEDIIGDILPVKIKNSSMSWENAPSARAFELMGLEKMMCSFVDYPDEMHALYKFLKDEIIAYIRWQEKENLLVLNNENDYVGAGSYGFTCELPAAEFKKDGIISSKDLWGNMNSQETIGISPEMYGEFVFPYYYELAKEFGLVYYGCCEPVHNIWERYISKLPGLRKVSVSPWCDEEYMGSALKGGKVIYSRKPSPNFIGVGKTLDEAGFSAHIGKTLRAAKGCSLEFIFRDILTLSGNISKPGRAVNIVREMIEKMW